jgi:8-oxo-dGTP pyrophosphatase MutT (NUDIX family)
MSLPSAPASPSRSGISTDEARALEQIDPALYNAGLAAVHGLTPELLRQRFKDTRAWTREMLGDEQHGKLVAPGSTAGYRKASVLIVVVVREQLQVLLTRRSSQLRDHAGQISFPGGRAEPGDADEIATALREAEEEIGLVAAHLEVIGCLPSYHTVSTYVITPVVALAHPPFELNPHAGEVAEAFEVPLDFLLDPANHQ